MAARDQNPERPFIAINPPLLTTHTFQPIELDYDIVGPKRVMRPQAVADIQCGAR